MKAILWRIWSYSNNPDNNRTEDKVWKYSEIFTFYRMTTPTINGEKEKNSGDVLEIWLTVVILIIDRYIYLWTLQDYCFTLAWQKDRLLIFIILFHHIFSFKSWSDSWVSFVRPFGILVYAYILLAGEKK